MTGGDSHGVCLLFKTLLKKNCYTVMTLIVAGRHSVQDWLSFSDRGIIEKLEKSKEKELPTVLPPRDNSPTTECFHPPFICACSYL